MSNARDYHTDSRDYPIWERAVYHNHDLCRIGAKIQPAHREAGRGGGFPTKALCSECALLAERTDGSCATWF